MNHLNMQLSFDAVEAVSAGRTVRGILNIECPRRVKANQLKVFFKGEEHAKVYHRRGQRVRTYQEHQQIVQIPIPATDINAVLQQNDFHLPEGTYALPFSFRISSKLPSSVAFGDCNDSVKIEYWLEAEMLGSGIIHDYDAKHVIEVTARPKSVKRVSYVVPTQCHTIFGGLFFKRGKVEFGAHADDTLLVPGQQLKLDLAIVNESLASIHSVRVHLVEKAEWTVKEPHDGDSHTATRVTVLFDESLEASAVKKKSDEKVKAKVRESFRMRENFKLIDEQLATGGDSVLSLTLPPVPREAHNTFSGTFMKVRHDLTVTLETHATNSNPDFHIPIRIMRGRPSQLMTIEAK